MRALRSRRRGERGASAVEFALVAPVLAVMLVGCIELGLFFKDYIAMSSSVRTGARTASAAADAGPGTCEASGPTPPPCVPANVPKLAQLAADTMQQEGTALNRDDIDYILVYKANDKGFPGATGATTLTCTSNCVKFVWDKGLNRYRYASGQWISTTINACVNDPNRESVGIAMQATHKWVTGAKFFNFNSVMTERTVMQFEPLEADTCKPGTAKPHP